MRRAEQSDLEIGFHSSGRTEPYSGRMMANLDRYSIIAYRPMLPDPSVTTLAVVADTVGWPIPEDDWDDRSPPSQDVIEAINQHFDETELEDVLATLVGAFNAASLRLADLSRQNAVTCAAAVVL